MNPSFADHLEIVPLVYFFFDWPIASLMSAPPRAPTPAPIRVDLVFPPMICQPTAPAAAPTAAPFCVSDICSTHPIKLIETMQHDNNSSNLLFILAPPYQFFQIGEHQAGINLLFVQLISG